MLELNEVSKTFKESGNFEVLRAITFSVPKGDFVCILGPSGCGKSILLSLIAGFYPPTNGDLRMDGHPISRPEPSRMMLFQQSLLFPWKSALDNVVFGLSFSKASLSSKREQAMEQLRLVGMESFADWHPHKLSGGMQQRVALARALIADPEVLLMDEPFAALDAQYRKYCQELLLHIWKMTGKTIVFVTHSVSEAIRLADTIHLFSARPAQIRHSYVVDLPRPRDQEDPKYHELRRQIERDLEEEFQKIVNTSQQTHAKLMSLTTGI